MFPVQAMHLNLLAGCHSILAHLFFFLLIRKAHYKLEQFLNPYVKCHVLESQDSLSPTNPFYSKTKEREQQENPFSPNMKPSMITMLPGKKFSGLEEHGTLPSLEKYKSYLMLVTEYSENITITDWVVSNLNRINHGDGTTPQDQLLVNEMVAKLRKNNSTLANEAADALTACSIH